MDIVLIQSLQVPVKGRAEAVEIGNNEHQKTDADEHPECAPGIGMSPAGRIRSIHKAIKAMSPPPKRWGQVLVRHFSN
jgi:hypothetical protein